MGKSTISMPIFNSFLYVYQRVDQGTSIFTIINHYITIIKHHYYSPVYSDSNLVVLIHDHLQVQNFVSVPSRRTLWILGAMGTPVLRGARRCSCRKYLLSMD